MDIILQLSLAFESCCLSMEAGKLHSWHLDTLDGPNHNLPQQ